MNSTPRSLSLNLSSLKLHRAGLLRARARTQTPGEWNRKFLPHYFAKYEPADFHAAFDSDLHNLHTRRGSKLSYIAPRGGAKSTWCTLAYPLRAALEGWERYTAILSDSSDQANQQLGHIKAELETNQLLADVYPDAAGQGPEWKQNRITLQNGAVIEAFGTGKKIRGRRNRSERPSLIIFDDVQSNEDITSDILRDRAWEWATREVLLAGDEKTNYLAVGSAIHREAVSVQLGKLAGWKGHTYKAVHSWPDRMDLWEEFNRLATNLADENRLVTAKAFYLARASEMNRGAKVYWPEKFPLAEIMLLRAQVGPAAFESEYQGVPGAGQGIHFPPEYFDYAGFWFDQWPDDQHLVLKVVSLDPSKAATDVSDLQAHAIVALGVNGTIYADAELERETISQMVSRSLDLCKRHRPHCAAIETNQGLDLLLPEFVRQANTRGLVAPLKGVQNYSVGKRRIERLAPYFANRQIRMRNTAGARMLVDQLRDYPEGRHDDGPDALEIAVRMLELLTGGGE